MKLRSLFNRCLNNLAYVKTLDFSSQETMLSVKFQPCSSRNQESNNSNKNIKDSFYGQSFRGYLILVFKQKNAENYQYFTIEPQKISKLLDYRPIFNIEDAFSINIQKRVEKDERIVENQLMIQKHKQSGSIEFEYQCFIDQKQVNRIVYNMKLQDYLVFYEFVKISLPYIYGWVHVNSNRLTMKQ